MSDQNLTELVRAIGNLEGSFAGVIKAVDDFKEEQRDINEALWKSLNHIDRTLSNHRIKMAGINAGVSGGTAAFIVGIIEAGKWIYKLVS